MWLRWWLMKLRGLLGRVMMSEHEVICQFIYLFARHYFYKVKKGCDNILIYNSHSELISSVYVPSANVSDIKVYGGKYYGGHEAVVTMNVIVDFIKMVYDIHSYPQTVFNILINLNG